MIEYQYENIFEKPLLGITDEENNLIAGIHYDVLQISNYPELLYCSWNIDESHILRLYFSEELTNEEKIVLDEIVSRNVSN